MATWGSKKKTKSRSKKKNNSLGGRISSSFSRLGRANKAVVFIAGFALIGGIITVAGSLAGRTNGLTHQHLLATPSIGESKVTETRNSKRNARVVQITNQASVTTAKAVYAKRVDAGKYEACFIGVSQKGSPRGTLSVRAANAATGSSLGSEDYAAVAGSDYVKMGCILIDHKGGTGDAGVLEVMITNTAPDTALRISIISLEDRDTPAPPHHEDCAVGTMGVHGPCIDSSKIPAARVGRSDSTLENHGIYGAEPGSFRSRCDYSHMNNDDAILYPGQPGRAHLHTYFGNTGANASSTSSSLLNSGNSTCAGGIFNRSAYWVPTLVNSRTGEPLRPNDDRSIYNSDLEIYYKIGYQGVGYGDIQPFPNGLHIIAGNAATATTPPTSVGTLGYPVHFWCEPSEATNRTRRAEATSIPHCTAGEALTMSVKFPQCWDGKNLTSSNGRSHMAYGTWQPGTHSDTRGCPSTHPVGLPGIEMFVRWRVKTGDDTRNWRFASDRYTNAPGGYSAHADYMFAWNETAFPTITQYCYRALRDCGYTLGNGKEPQWHRITR